MGILEPPTHLRSIVTRRTLLPPPATRSTEGWEASWAHLGEVYTPALIRYTRELVRRRGIHMADQDEAIDIVQAFLAKTMESGSLGKSQDEIRVFRAWIATHLRRFINDYYDGKFAQKRAGPQVPEDALLAVGSPGSDPALGAFDKELVWIAIQHSMHRMRQGESAPKLGSVYAGIIDDLILTDGEGSVDIAARLGFDPEMLPTYKHRARKLLSRLFVGELRTMVRDERGLQELLQELESLIP